MIITYKSSNNTKAIASMGIYTQVSINKPNSLRLNDSQKTERLA